MKKLNTGVRPYLILVCIGALLFLPFLGQVHLFDWDEINFAEAAREMLVTHDYLRVKIDFEPFWEKPPLFIWLQAFSMQVFGVNEFAARLPNALLGIFTFPVLYGIGRQVKDARLGWLWVGIYAGSFLPHFYFRSGIIDPWFNVFIFCGLYALYRYHSAGHTLRQPKWLLTAAVATGLAVLTKGPVGYLLVGLTWLTWWAIQYVQNRKHKAPYYGFPLWEGVVFTLVALLVTGLWYGVDLLQHGPWFLQQFFSYQLRLLTTGDAGHGEPVYYHFVVLLIGCFPASALLWGALAKNTSINNPKANDFKLWMVVLLIVVLVVFSAVKTKIVHYSSLAYFPITFLAAYTVYVLAFQGSNWRRVYSWLIGILGTIWALLLTLVPLIGMYGARLTAGTDPLVYIKDPFARANLLAEVHWSGWELLIGPCYLGVAIAGLILFHRKQMLAGTITLFAGTAFTICLVLPVIVPRVEGYSQRAAIEFFESKQGCNCYLQPLEYKSYAQYFYGRVQPRYSPSGAGVRPDSFATWLQHGPIDRTAYFACKVQDSAHYHHLTLLYAKNGFVFFKREPASPDIAADTSVNEPAPGAVKSAGSKP